MKTPLLVAFLWGVLSTLCVIAGLFFLRFWLDTRERILIYFALAFWMFSLSWAARLVVQTDDESSYLLYVFRLLAFCLILTGIIDKNWRSRLR
jgi:hypothetical protein